MVGFSLGGLIWWPTGNKEPRPRFGNREALVGIFWPRLTKVKGPLKAADLGTQNGKPGNRWKNKKKFTGPL